MKSRFLLIALMIQGIVPLSSYAGTSTTDFLVRFEALAYLEKLNGSKDVFKREIESLNADEHKLTKEEKRIWNQEISDAQNRLAELIAKVEQEIALLRESETVRKARLEADIVAAERELRSFRKPNLTARIVNGVWDYATSLFREKDEDEDFKSEEEKKDALANNIAYWKVEIKKIEALLDKPLALAEKAEEKFAREKVELDNRIGNARINLDLLSKRDEIMKLRSTRERYDARVASTNNVAACMINLAKCGAIRRWDSFNTSDALKCKQENLAAAKRKATNPKCASLSLSSSWLEVDACIPEYRAVVLRKGGTEGSRREFDNCRKR